MTHLHLGHQCSALAASITGISQPKQTGTTTPNSPIRVYINSSSGSPDTFTMGKSNKFDYSKRGNSASKLGNIIARDLQKEVERAAKDAEKAAAKVRKRSTGSNSSGTREPAVAIDLQAPKKELGDDGVCAMASGLEVSLGQGRVLLEDLNLSGNQITTVSLARLVPSIKLARHDLKTLNLSDNHLKVETAEEAVQWEAFLRAFEGCFKLRRLDLSGNVSLGARALEIMARVHISEPAVNPMPYRGETSVISLNFGEEPNSPGTCSVADRMSSGGYIKRRVGLRSIPYITLTNIGMDDLSALWLSFILEEHHYPNQLIDGLNATLASSTIATYQQNANYRGVDWDPKEPNLSRDSLYLLQKAENFREQMMLTDDEAFDGAEYEQSLQGAEDESAGRRSSDRRFSRALPGDRRASIRSIQTADGGEHELSELESARRRLQRTLITNSGVSKVELWCTALRLVISSRVLLGIGPDSRDSARFYIGPPQFDFTSYSPTAIANKNIVAPRPVTPVEPVRPGKNSFDIGLGSPAIPSRQGTYAATLTANTGALPGDSEIAITDATNSPRTPKILLKSHRKGAFSDGSDLQQVTEKLDSLVMGDTSPQRFVRWQEERIEKHAGSSTTFRNREIRSHLPGNVIDLIAGFTVTEREKGLLSAKQLQDALAWGQRRANSVKEKEWRRMPDSSQAWFLLEGIGCLAYQRQ